MFDNDLDLVKFSHSLRVMFVNCVDCNKDHAIELFRVFFTKIDTAGTKEEALELFKNNKYDLMIIGLKIPEVKDGIDLIERIRNISKNITILTIASDLDTYEFTKLIELNVDGFIIKPVYIKQFSDIIHKTLFKLKNKEDLYHYRLDLENKVKTQVKLLRQKDAMLFQQSKLAAMGEMMDAVAHQWKQPINNIKMRVDLLEYDFEDGKVDKDYIKKYKDSIFNQFDHMVTTLNEFRTFFRPNKEVEDFDAYGMIEKVLLLVKDEFLKNNINIQVNKIDDFTIRGVENEFKHLILNIINNSKDAFNEKNIQNRRINIDLLKKDSLKVIQIEDNAGGIAEHIIEHIFKANITTKRKSNGTGIGLYMSSQIAQKHNANIKVSNTNDGVRFTVTFL